MTTRCQEYRYEAASIDGLVQQVAVSYLRHGYFYYVSGVLRPKVNREVFAEHILTKYNIRKCWRYRAQQKARGHANLQFIMHGQFYVIMATEGEHRFKDLERKALREVTLCPLVVPIQTGALWSGKTKKQKKRREDPRIEECYVIGYERGRYERKTPEERAAYRKAVETWRRNKLNGKRLPRPARGKEKVAWHPTVAIEDESYLRLWDYFMTYATKWPSEKLAMELRATPYQPYWAVKRQLFEILCEVNRVRKIGGLDDLRYRVVHQLKRPQIFPFGPPRERRGEQSEAALKCA